MGEYLGRVYEQTRGRPLFLVEAVVRQEKEPGQGPDKADTIE